MSSVVVRPVQTGDAEAVREIYNYAVRETTATMSTADRTAKEQAEWINAHDGFPYPAFAAETVEGGHVVGYASLSPFIPRDGYRPTVETSVYVHPDWHNVGVGSALLSVLVTDAARRGLASCLALISADNAASLRLHARYGFFEVGVMRRVGFKFDRWIDVAIWQKFLQNDTQECSKP